MPAIGDNFPGEEIGARAESARVRLGPLQEADPFPSRMPVHNSLRWLSPFERAGDEPPVAVFVTQPAYVRICSLAGRDVENEVGGVLVGQWRVDRRTGQQFVVVEAAISARNTKKGKAFLTFTQESLVGLNTEQEERFPDKRVVGWFHTHPRMGVFLSDYDAWLHRHFFPEPWQVALVIEPHAQWGGFFVRNPEGGMDVHRYFGFRELVGGSEKSLVYWNNLDLDNRSGT